MIKMSYPWEICQTKKLFMRLLGGMTVRPILYAAIPAFAILTSTAANATLNSDTNFNDFRGVWITRWEMGGGSSSSKIDTIINNCKKMGLNELAFQVRGCGTAYYNNSLDTELQKGKIDSLGTAISSAHGLNMNLHAYINTIPMWSGDENHGKPSDDPNQLWNSHPDWRLKKANGQTMPMQDKYNPINPCLPEVQNYYKKLVNNIATNYKIDGLHLDYVRMLGTAINDGYLADKTTVDLYRKDKGLPSNAKVNTKSDKYKDWVGDQITKVVDNCNDALKAVRPDAVLTAATWKSPTIAKNDYQQHAGEWAENGNVDAVMPMNYQYNDSPFRTYFNTYKISITKPPISPASETISSTTHPQNMAPSISMISNTNSTTARKTAQTAISYSPMAHSLKTANSANSANTSANSTANFSANPPKQLSSTLSMMVKAHLTLAQDLDRTRTSTKN